MPTVKKHYNDRKLASLVATVGRNLRFERERAGLSQSKLAKQSKVALSTINEIENQVVKDIRFSTVSTLARALDVEPLSLLIPTDLDFSSDDRADFIKAWKILERLSHKLR